MASMPHCIVNLHHQVHEEREAYALQGFNHGRHGEYGGLQRCMIHHEVHEGREAYALQLFIWANALRLSRAEARGR
jgi:hypothetical protein